MDSLSHVIIGAATGQAVLGREAGNKALFWGAVAGSLPDLDSAITWMYEPVQALFVHRGFSHSIFFALLAAPILGWALSKLHNDIDYKKWTLLWLVGILIHSIIDCFNTYGTALLSPISSKRLAFDSMGIIDFGLLLPMLILIIILLLKNPFSKTRNYISYIILGFALVYIGLSAVNKMMIEKNIKHQLENQNIDYIRLKTAPLPITNYLWLILAEDSMGYYVGYFSNFDKKDIEFKYVNRNNHLLGELKENSKILDLINFTEGFYKVDIIEDGSLWLYDLRFGSMAFDKENWFVFSFKIEHNDEIISISRAHPNRSFGKQTLSLYWRRLFRDV